jgi:hypothetical protein
MEDELLVDVAERLGEGFFRDPAVFLRGTPRRDRVAIEAALDEGQLTIEKQEEQPFQLNTTFKRPRMVKLSDLLAQGYTL